MMTTTIVDVTLRPVHEPPPVEVVDTFTDDLQIELEKIESVIDPSISATLSSGLINISMEVDSKSGDEALMTALKAVRQSLRALTAPKFDEFEPHEFFDTSEAHVEKLACA